MARRRWRAVALAPAAGGEEKEFSFCAVKIKERAEACNQASLLAAWRGKSLATCRARERHGANEINRASNGFAIEIRRDDVRPW